MVSAANLGEFEQLILLAILRLRDNAYGVTIRAELTDRAGRNVAGCSYTALERPPLAFAFESGPGTFAQAWQ
jgi:PadR family transcriptional regulator, regulatory protein PadR